MNAQLITALLDIDMGDGKYGLIAVILVLIHKGIVQALKSEKKLFESEVKNKADIENLTLQKAFEQEIFSIHKQYTEAITKLEDVHDNEMHDLVTRFSKGKCQGAPGRCAYQIYFRQSIALSAHILVIKVQALELFARDLQDAAEKGRIIVTSSSLSTILLCHNVLMDAAFNLGMEKVHDLLHDEVIPKSSSTSRSRFILEKAKEFNAIVWGYYSKSYVEKLYLLKYKDRKAKFKRSEPLFLKEFEAFINIADDISKDPYGKSSPQ